MTFGAPAVLARLKPSALVVPRELDKSQIRMVEGDNLAPRDGNAKRQEPPLQTPSYVAAENVRNLTAELNVLLADVFAIYTKTSGDVS